MPWPDIVTDDLELYYHAARAEGGMRPGHNGGQVRVLHDLSGNNNHGTLRNAAMTTASGWDGAGTSADPYRVVLDGTDDYVSCGDLSVAEDKTFTYEAWFATTTTDGAYHDLISEGHTTGTGYAHLRLNSTHKADITIRDDAASYVAVYDSVALNDGDAHHLVAACDDSLTRLYVDGSLVGTPAAPPGGSISIDVAAVGAFVTSGVDKYFPGDILIARIYSAALTADQVAQNHAAGYLWTEDAATGIVRPRRRAA